MDLLKQVEDDFQKEVVLQAREIAMQIFRGGAIKQELERLKAAGKTEESVLLAFSSGAFELGFLQGVSMGLVIDDGTEKGLPN